MSGSADTVRVLHVDDNREFADLTAEFLEREDERVTVESETNVGDALDRLESGAFDCVVSDYEMPGRDGIEFLEAVRAEYPDLPFVLFTGRGGEAIASEAISAGVTDYLQKEGSPSQYAVLANRVSNAVEQYRARRELEASRTRLSLFFEQSPLGVIEWNDRFEVVRANEAAEEILGYSAAELSGRSWRAIVPDSEHDIVAEIVEELRESRRSYRTDSETVRKDGERIVCEWHTHAVEEGEDSVFFSQFQDVTDEHRRRRRQQRQREALAELATDDAVGGGDFETAVRRITETAADVLDVPRVNVWLFDDGGDRLRCVDHYERPASSHDRGMELRAEEYPEYVEALETHLTIDAGDARSDPRTAELADDYFETHDIGALLDATLRSEGEVIGVVCHEHVGGPRDWTNDEIRFASTVADVVRRAHRNRLQREHERTLQGHKETLERLHDAANRLYAAESAEECLRITIDAAVSILGFDWCTVAAPAGDGEYFEIKAISDGAPLERGDRPFRLDEGIAGRVYQTGEPSLVGDVAEAERGEPTDDSIRAALTVPVGEWGVFQAVATTPDAFDDQDRTQAELLAASMCTAIERAER